MVISDEEDIENESATENSFHPMVSFIVLVKFCLFLSTEYGNLC